MQDEQPLIDIWYKGLNDAFRKTRGPMATAGCHDNPKVRLIYYGVVGLALTSMGAGVAIVIFLMKEILWLALICAVVAIGTLFQAALFFNAFLKIKQAIDQGENTDQADPLRFKVMARALSWGLKKGLVVKDQEGKYQMR